MEPEARGKSWTSHESLGYLTLPLLFLSDNYVLSGPFLNSTTSINCRGLRLAKEMGTVTTRYVSSFSET
jgi:hypothetical protein